MDEYGERVRRWSITGSRDDTALICLESGENQISESEEEIDGVSL